MLKFVISLTFITLMLCGPLHAQTSPQTSPSDKGTAIGTTVRAALDAAFPGAGTLASLFIDAASTKIKMKKEQKAEVKTAVEAAAQAKEDEAKAKANAKLRELAIVATQLNVVSSFADISAASNEEIIRIISYLSTHQQPTSAEWTANVRSRWEGIKGDLDRLKAYDDDIVLSEKVKDIYVRDLLSQILRARATKLKKLDTLIGNTPENVDLIKQQLVELQPLFSSISRVATLQVKTLALDLQRAANPEKMGSEEDELKKRFESIQSYVRTIEAQ